MTFENTDILCVAAGLGATYAAANFGSRYKEAASVDEALKLVAAHECRYVLLDANLSTRVALDMESVEYVVVAPHMKDLSDWIARWLKAGSTAASIGARIRRWRKNLDIYSTPELMVAYLSPDLWLTQILEQSAADPTDRKDV